MKFVGIVFTALVTIGSIANLYKIYKMGHYEYQNKEFDGSMVQYRRFVILNWIFCLIGSIACACTLADYVITNFSS